MVQIERLTESVKLGEAPHWDPYTQSLYYVDIVGMSIYQYHPSNQKISRASVGLNLVSFIIPVEGETHQFVVALGRDIVRIFWNSDSDDVRVIEKVAEVEQSPEFIDHRFNDGKCDSSGRLWAGTFCTTPQSFLVYPSKGTLYSINSKRKVTEHLKHVQLSNGIAFDEKLKKMYYVDSCKGTVDQYDFDISLGTISNCKSIFQLINHGIRGIPDGMTIDTDGNLWVAIFNGSKIIKIDPRRPETLLKTIEMPAKQVTSLTFGGSNLDELYVTTGAYKLDHEDLPQPENGALYRIKGVGAKGLPPYNFRLVNV